MYTYKDHETMQTHHDGSHIQRCIHITIMYWCIYIHIHIHICIQIHIHIHVHIHIHIHIHIHTTMMYTSNDTTDDWHRYVCVCVYMYEYTCIDIYSTSTYSCAWRHPHAQRCLHALPHSHTFTKTHIYTNICTHVKTH